MTPPGDLSDRCLVLATDAEAYEGILRPAVQRASLPDGRPLEPTWVDPSAARALAPDEPLGALEWGAVLLVDLVGLDPRAFPLVALHARMRSGSTILLRRGTVALPFELREFAVRPYAPGATTERPALRDEVATAVTEAARRRAGEGPVGVRLPWGKEAAAARRRRDRSGVTDLLLLSDRDLLDGDVHAARSAAEAALALEPEAPDLLLRLALLQRALGNLPAALGHLERAARLDPDRPATWRELGIARDRCGQPGAEAALRRAIELGEDYEALVTLALLLARDGWGDEPGHLLEQALAGSGGQLNLVLPTLTLRAGRERRIRLSAEERTLVGRVLEIRRRQAEAQPPEDAPWSHLDAASALVLLGDEASARLLVESARPHVHAGWNLETFAQACRGFERAGVDVGPMRAALGIRERAPSGVIPAPAAPESTFRAEARDAAWFAKNVPCMTACPVGTDAGAYVHLLAEGRVEEAFRVARGPNPFASVCGRVCAAPCEDACRRGHVDEAVAIRPLKRFLTERHGVEGTAPRVDDVLRGAQAPCIEGEAYVSHVRRRRGSGANGPRVAIVGGGPAGLACAHDLAVLGYRVTIFEAGHQLGGMMRQGIPVYRLPRDLLDREIGWILGLGVEVRLTTPLDATRTLGSLLEEGFEAAFLGSGAGRGRDLEVEGGHLDGVVRAIEFLINVNAGFRAEVGARVVVVGGGNVAMDVARTAHRGSLPRGRQLDRARADARRDLGPALPGHALFLALRGPRREVHVVARQPMGAWPAQRSVHGAQEVQEAMEEGVTFHPLRGLRRILGEEGRVHAVELAEVVQLRDASGRYAPVYGSHAAETIPCDTVFLAVGQEPELDYLEATKAVKRSSRGLIEVDPATLATSMPGVFAGGDAAFGPRTLIEAVADGKRAARGIDRHLRGSWSLAPRYAFTHLHPRGVGTQPGYDAIPRTSPPVLALDRRTGIAEVEGGYDEAEARRQAARCLVCHVQTVYDGSRCIACGRCTDVCPHACLSFVRPSDVRVEGLDAGALAASAGGPQAVFMIKDEDACIRCGLCAERCPTGAMTMERFEMAMEATA